MMVNHFLLKKRQKSRHNSGDVNRKLQARLFGLKQGEFQRDPMRLVHLADTEAIKSNAITSKILFAINCPRQEWVNQQGQTGSRHSPPQRLKTQLETLPESGLRAFSSHLTIQKVNQPSTDSEVPATNLCWTMDQIAKACNRFLPALTGTAK